jgi:nicotinamidase-related amidase
VAPPPASDAFTEPHLETSALLVIDMQADFLDDGPAAFAGTSAVLPELIGLVTAYRAAGRPIVHVVRLYQGDDVDLVRRAALRAGAPVVRPGSAGARVAPGLLPAPEVELDGEALLAGHLQRVGPGEVVLWKPRWSAFHRTPLDDHLRQLGVDTVVVAGCNFPNCPRATVFDASGRDYRVVVVPDATSQVTPERLADAEALGVHPVPAAEVVRAVARAAATGRGR